MQVQLVLMKLVLVWVVVMVLFDGITGTAITAQVLLMKLLQSTADTANSSKVVVLLLIDSYLGQCLFCWYQYQY